MFNIFNLRFFRGFFSIWIVFLLISGFFIQRDVLFFDVLSNSDVSSQYISEIPGLRYFIEPIAGITFNVLSRELIWLGTFLCAYIPIRLCWLYYSRVKKVVDSRQKIAAIYLLDILRFNFISFLIVFSSIFLILLISIQFRGFIFPARHSQTIFLKGVYFCAVFLAIKIAVVVFRFLGWGIGPLKVKKRSSSKNSSMFFWNAGREILILFYFLFLLAILNFLFISLPLPTHRIKADLDKGEYLLDFHSHTTVSDGYLTPEQRIDWYIKQGIHGAAVTDHNQVRGAVMAKEIINQKKLNFFLILGSEYTNINPHIHLNIFGINKDIFPADNTMNILGVKKTIFTKPDNDSKELVLNIKDMIKYVHERGGWVIVNHYNRAVKFSKEELKSWDVDGFEVSTGYLSTKESRIAKFCLKHDLICVGGSDEHQNREINRFVRLKIEPGSSLSMKTVMEALRKKEHQAVRIDLYPKRLRLPKPIPKTSEAPENFVNYLLNLDEFQALSWIIWSSLLFTLVYRFSLWLKNMDEVTIIAKIKYI